MPFEPDVFGNASRSQKSNARRSSSATRAHSTIVAGGPGSRSNATIVGCSISGARAIGVCSSRSARLASQTIVGRSWQRQKSMLPSLRPDQTDAVCTHSGACDGQRFS